MYLYGHLEDIFALGYIPFGAVRDIFVGRVGGPAIRKPTSGGYAIRPSFLKLSVFLMVF